MKLFCINFFLLFFIQLSAQEINPLEIFIKDSVVTVKSYEKLHFLYKFLRGKIFNQKIKLHVEVKNNTGDTLILYYFDRRLPVNDCILKENSLESNISDSILFMENKEILISPYISYLKYYKSQCIGLQYKFYDTVGKCKTKVYIHSIIPRRIHYISLRSRISFLIDDLNNLLINILPRRNQEKYINKIVIMKDSSIEKKLILLYTQSKRFHGIDEYGYKLSADSTYNLSLQYWVTLNNVDDIYFTKRIPYMKAKKSPMEIIREDIEKNNYDKEKVFQGIVKSNTVKVIVK